jgi:outer membrane protein assembly factor BamB
MSFRMNKNSMYFIFPLLLGIFFCNELKSQDSTCYNDTITPIIHTFLGNWQRNFYGYDAPDSLEIIWKLNLGTGETVISRRLGKRIWSGAGWTGQPLLVNENNRLFLIQGAYDHHLKKIDADSGKIIWQYKFDDVIKGTGTIWVNKNTDSIENSLVILQGSRLGTSNFLDSKYIPSYRAVSYFTGKELWRFDQKWTSSYSRDVDGSALILNDTAYIGFENSLFTVFDPDHCNADTINGMFQPRIFEEHQLYNNDDVIAHKKNIVTESSPAILGDRIYVASGAGHVWGYNLKTRTLDWDFFIGSDMDGSVVVTSDSCILVSVERQYIRGKGGVFKLNPFKSPEDAVEWYFPVENKDFNGWEGGVIGSVGINDHYVKSDSTNLAAFMGIDGYLYVVDHKVIDTLKMVLGPDSITSYPTPKLIYKEKVGPSISTPIFTHNKLIAAGYWGISLYNYSLDNKIVLSDKKSGSFESTPIIYGHRVYIASRNGYLYCFGDKN